MMLDQILSYSNRLFGRNRRCGTGITAGTVESGDTERTMSKENASAFLEAIRKDEALLEKCRQLV
jgi:hypothetical protein